MRWLDRRFEALTGLRESLDDALLVAALAQAGEPVLARQHALGHTSPTRTRNGNGDSR